MSTATAAVTMTEDDVRNRLGRVYQTFEDGELTFVLSSKKLTAARFLTRELKLKDFGWSDHQIRDLAERLNKEQQPDDVIQCKTPEDWTEMFKAAPTCMKVQPDGYYTSGNVCMGILKKYNLWPSAWYHYCPQIEGYFSVRKGKPNARCYIINGNMIGSCYGDSPVAQEMLINHFKKNGFSYDPMHYNSMFSLTEEFKVPAVEFKEKLYCPMPNCDNLRKPFNMGFDKETKEFLFGPSQKMVIGDTYRYGGWICSTQVKI